MISARGLISLILMGILYFLFRKAADANEEFNVGWTAALISLFISNVLGGFIAHSLFGK